MCTKHFRPLEASEVEARVGSTYKKDGKITAVSVLLYKDARVDMTLLDEEFGIFGWKRSHELIDGHLFCSVSVKDPETGEWVTKQDVGVESNTEATKGEASDSFKRACFNLGIGRELYTAPFIYIEAQQGDLRGDKWATSFKVKELGYDDKGRINKVVITDAKGNVRYSYGQKQAQKPAQPRKSQADYISEAQIEIARAQSYEQLIEIYKRYSPLVGESVDILTDMCATAKKRLENGAA